MSHYAKNIFKTLLKLYKILQYYASDLIQYCKLSLLNCKIQNRTFLFCYKKIVLGILGLFFYILYYKSKNANDMTTPE